jgi:hypothetical protein
MNRKITIHNLKSLKNMIQYNSPCGNISVE